MNTTLVALALNLASQENSLPPGLLSAVCWVESSHRPQMIHKEDGAHSSLGLCQVQLRTARALGYTGTEDKLLTPMVNAFYAAKYLVFQYKRYGTWEKAVIAYNRGNATGLTSCSYLRKVQKALHEKR